MFLQPLRGLIAIALVASCSRGTYLDDASVRRDALESSLANTTNGYARLRLAKYASGKTGDWDSLPEWNPRTELVRLSDLGRDAIGQDAHPIALGSDLRRIGEDAFFHYPVQAAPAVKIALASGEHARAYGLQVGDSVGGIVRVEGEGFAYTCATCHFKNAPGAPNDELDLGALIVDAHLADETRAKNLLAWGPGRLDVTTIEGTEPVRIPDLRPVRFQTHLHAAGNVVQTDVNALAVRIETLLITSNGERTRPPRAIALGLATYLRSLADSLPHETRTNATFETHCAGCHRPPDFTGPPVSIDVVGTDPRVGRSLERGTGNYRVPSLRGVSTRGPLLHDASMKSLEMMFDPTRAGGHRFGLDLDDGARADLVSYLKTL